ncbi:MAG: hypothetical protein WAW62_01575 [Candidatus Saccharimonas aalborgensis]|jgi:uncharacterized membrane protein
MNNSLDSTLSSLTAPILIVIVLPIIVSLILVIALLVKFWNGMTALERMLPLIDDIHYWIRARYESDKRNGVIIEADADNAEKKI